MSEFKGTPGTWNVAFHGSDNCWIVDSENDSAIAKVTRYKGEGVIQKANFNLIAAAPDLLEALQWLQMALASGTSMDICIGQEKAETAIAKALGESK